MRRMVDDVVGVQRAVTMKPHQFPGELPKGCYFLFAAGSDAAREAGATEPYGTDTVRVWVPTGAKNKLPCQYARIEEPCKVCAHASDGECARYLAWKEASAQ